jgi:taurine--2-oxoglutarate transaminase
VTTRLADKTDWNTVVEWDKKYRMHVEFTDEEYQSIPIARAEGDYLITPDGTRLLDCLNQLICVNAGQAQPKIQQAIRDATERYGFLWEYFTTDYNARASKLLIEDILGPYDWAGKVGYTNSGSESVEMALMLARVIKNRPMVVTREHAYHGWTMGAAGANRLRGLRGGLSSSAQGGEFRPVPGSPFGGYLLAPAPDCFDCSLGYTYPDCKSACGGKLPCVLMTERLIECWGVEQIAAMITEPIFGASSFFPPPEYLQQLVNFLHANDILWICDEVLVGFGRMGTWFAHQLPEFGVLKPDLMTMAKGIVSSALPAGAVAISKELAEIMGNYRWMHVATFAAHPLAMAAVCANLELMIEKDGPGCARKAGEYLAGKFKELEAKHKTVGMVTGSGVLWTVELVKNKKTKERFCPDDRVLDYTGDLSKLPTRIIGAKCMEKNVILTGFTPNALRIGFSLFVTKEDMDKAIDALDYALTYLDTLA